tara:strand:+ start:4950 stop:5408 length:459 start_codon:yes stop_codon:yes gene_type:complete
MSVTALTTFVTISGDRTLKFQNSTQSIITFKGDQYSYLPMIYQGATRTRDGSNMEAALVLANNAISMNYVIDAVKNKSTITVVVCLMNPETFTYIKTLSRDIWMATSMSYDPKTIEVILSSAIDAVGAICPNRKITEPMVGALPTTSDIRNI